MTVLDIRPLSSESQTDEPQAGAEDEATAIATDIAGLRGRLRRGSTLEHPAVLQELRELEEQLAAQLDRSERPPGRHRCS